MTAYDLEYHVVIGFVHHWRRPKTGDRLLLVYSGSVIDVDPTVSPDNWVIFMFDYDE